MKRDYNKSDKTNRKQEEKGFFEDQTDVQAFSLEEMIRGSAQTMIQAAVEDEVTEFLGRLPHQKSVEAEGFRGYRNGYQRERTITTSVGALNVKMPRVSDIPKEAGNFESDLIKPYRRRSKGLDELFPKLFVEGLSTRDFEPALRALLGEDAPLSPSTISRLNKQFISDYLEWKSKSLEDLPIVYIWVDGIYLKAGIADEKLCVLVMIGVDMAGRKHLLALEEGYRESKESWLEVLRDLRDRGLNEPALAIADGGLGFWAALPEVWQQTKEQICWLHKMRNILNKLPKRERAEATTRLRAIYLAETKEEAGRLSELLKRDWKEFYPKAVECLTKALPRLLTFHEFPQEHARHLRTTNPIESPFATIRLRTKAARRFRSARSGLHLVFKVMQKCERNWHRISHPEKLKDVKLPEKLN